MEAINSAVSAAIRKTSATDDIIYEYITTVLADEEFDIGRDGEGAFEALGSLLVEVRVIF
jgi:ATP-binding cassette, subfamily F, member 3